jgi:hypothetical protein
LGGELDPIDLRRLSRRLFFCPLENSLIVIPNRAAEKARICHPAKAAEKAPGCHPEQREGSAFLAAQQATRTARKSGPIPCGSLTSCKKKQVVVIPSEARDLLFLRLFEQRAQGQTQARFPLGSLSQFRISSFAFRFSPFAFRLSPFALTQIHYQEASMTNPNPGPGIATRCQFHFSDGRCCRMLRSPAHASFCTFHAKQELQLLESQRLGGEISSSLHGDFLTATDINHVLGKLFIAAAQDRIPVRKATALAFLGQVMLSSIPLIKQEFRFEYKFNQWREALANAAPLSDPPALSDSNSSIECPAELPQRDTPEDE